MHLQIARGNYLKGEVARGSSSLVFQPSTLHKNVLLLTTLHLEDGSVHRIFMRADLNSDGYQHTLSSSGEFVMMTLLKMSDLRQVSKNEFILDIGMRTGSGIDFEGKMAAYLKLHFLEQAQQYLPEPFFGETYELPKAIFENQGGEGFLLDFHQNEVIKDAFSTHQSIQVEAEYDYDGKIKIEKCVEIHLLNDQGELLSVVDWNPADPDNPNWVKRDPITIHYGRQPLYILAIIKPTKMEDGTFSFEIGDPEVDAKVKVTVEDV